MANDQPEINENTYNYLLFPGAQQYEEMALTEVSAQVSHQNVPVTNTRCAESHHNNQVDVQPYERLLIRTMSSRFGDKQRNDTNNYQYLRQKVHNYVCI